MGSGSSSALPVLAQTSGRLSPKQMHYTGSAGPRWFVEDGTGKPGPVFKALIGGET